MREDGCWRDFVYRLGAFAQIHLKTAWNDGESMDCGDVDI